MPARLRWKTLLFFALSCGILAFGALCHASPEDTQSGENSSNYEGVTPGSGNNLPRIVELKEKKGTWVTWPGFMMLPQGDSRVFLQTTDTLEYKVVHSPTKIVLRIKKARIFLPNNRNPLVTTHFDTPLRRAELRPRGRDVELTLLLKYSAVPVITQTADEDGYNYLFIDFPADAGAPDVTMSDTSD